MISISGLKGFSKKILVLTLALLLSVLQVNGSKVQASQNSGSVGFLNNDTNPTTGSIGNWGYSNAFAFDYQLRSIGVDQGSSKTFNQIRLFDNDGLSRLSKMDLSVYVSDDNVTYTRINDWDYAKVGNNAYIYNFTATGRYIKVHQHFENTDIYNFISNNLQEMVKVYNEPARCFIANGGGNWIYRKSISVTNSNSSTLYDRAVYITKNSLGTSTLISQGKMKADLGDVRFADSNDKELNFHMDDNGFYVRIPQFTAASGTVIYMYYGNPGATFRGDGDNTLQVEYGNKTLQDQTDGTGFCGNEMVCRMPNGNLFLVANNGGSSTGISRKLSSDGGQTWSAPQEIVNLYDAGRDEGGSFLTDYDTGTVFLFFYSYYYYNASYGLDPTKTRCDLYYSKTTDSGASWSTPVKLSTGRNYSLTYSGGIKLSTADGTGPNADYVMPFHCVTSSDGAFSQSVMYSNDMGQTWSKSQTEVYYSSSGFEGGTTEAAIIELDDGTLKMYMRCQVNGLYNFAYSTSSNKGVSWTSPAQISDVYASNTMPSMRRYENPGSIHDNDIMMIWGGNNTMGGTSYYRNPFTIAVSNDETATWGRHLDLLGRTWLSTPYVDGSGTVIVQPGFTGVGGYAYYFTFNKANFSNPATSKAMGILIEDFERYLYKTHGGYDGFEDSNLKYDYWWECAASVQTSTTKKYSGNSSLRIYDSSTSLLTRGSRYLPSIRKGTIKFKLNASSLSSMFVIELKEAYSTTHSSPGDLFQLQVLSDGSLKYKNSSGVVSELPVQTDLAISRWYDVELRFNTNTDQIEVLIDGQSKGTVGSYMAGNFINFLQFSSGSTPGTGTDVYIDDLIIQDTELALPVSDAIGSEEQTGTQRSYVQISSIKGLLNNDTNVYTGAIGLWGYSSDPVAVDYQSRSIGMDLSTTKVISKIELWDSDSSNRCNAANYELYWSNDNVSYTRITDLTFSTRIESSKAVHTFIFGDINARYIKVHTTYTDSSFTFTLNPFQGSVKTFQ